LRKTVILNNRLQRHLGNISKPRRWKILLFSLMVYEPTDKKRIITYSDIHRFH